VSGVVVDLGCQPQREDVSIERLVERFAPYVLYGFDPAASEELKFDIDKTLVFVSTAAAWTEDGTVAFSPAETRTRARWGVT